MICHVLSAVFTKFSLSLMTAPGATGCVCVLISTVVGLMKIRCWSKPGIYHVVQHIRSPPPPLLFRFSSRLESQHALKVSRTSWGYTVVELKQRNQPIRVGFMYANPNVIGRAKAKDCRMIPGHSSPPFSREPIFLFVCAFFLDLYVRMPFQGKTHPVCPQFSSKVKQLCSILRYYMLADIARC